MKLIVTKVQVEVYKQTLLRLQKNKRYHKRYKKVSITKGIFPGELKIADISPVFKMEDQHDKTNY